MTQRFSFLPHVKYGVNSGRNPDRKHWIPDKVRNDRVFKASSAAPHQVHRTKEENKLAQEEKG
jgi:hypothetical protein